MRGHNDVIVVTEVGGLVFVEARERREILHQLALLAAPSCTQHKCLIEGCFVSAAS